MTGDFTEEWATGSPARRQAALRKLDAYADLPAGAPEQIRSGVRDPAFLAQTKPRLDSPDVWGALLGPGERDRPGRQAATYPGMPIATPAARRPCCWTTGRLRVRTWPDTVTRPLGPGGTSETRR
ncbi:hypothetical protein [Streptomyces sp. NPDC049944]|uniref:hypothetical protein n=1 Tax=Streptomyces sp. NPDC049944 TaxID=3155657 RepID=UPI00341CB92C